MKVCFIYQGDSSDRRVFSGIPYHLNTYLKKYFDDFITLSPININHAQFFKIPAVIYSSVRRRLFPRYNNNFYDRYIYTKKLSKAVDQFLARNKIELVISCGVDPFIYTQSSIPMVQITGGTVRLMYEHYGGSKNWTTSFYHWLEWRSAEVMKKTDLIVCASQYCADSLKNYYKIPMKKIAVIPYGANIADDSYDYQTKKIAKNNIIKFLFVGKGWQRKGGDIAVQICDELKKRGYNPELIVIGSKVPDEMAREYIKNIEYLDKNIPEEYNMLISFYRNAHFYILPTRAEFFGVVFSEAAFYGLPAITSRSGAVPEIVLDNDTGLIMDPDPDIKNETDRIEKIINYPNLYANMSQSARDRFESVLNWDNYVKGLIQILISRKVLNI